MRFRPSSICKASSGLLLTMLAATPVFAAGQVSVACVDISGASGTVRVLELAATPVNEKYYSLAGTHKNSAGTIVGSAVGSSLVVGNELITTVNASSVVDDNSMGATLYQFNFDMTTWKGPYQGITQQSSFGSSTPATHKSGQAALVVDCNAPLTDFGGSTPDPTDCTTVDADDDGVAQCRAVLPGLNLPYDCDDNNSARFPGATEICGNGVDEDCSGSDLACTGSTDADDDGYTVAEGDCDDNNRAKHPGATEICGNNIDEDCSGSDLACSTVTDADGDGYSPNSVTSAPDCNDNNRAIHPGATEICGNNIDEDCSGSDLACSNYAAFTTGAGTAGGTLTQVGTGLVWQQGQYDPTVSGDVNWFGASKYCEDLSLGGYTDWRLPKLAELEKIVDDRYSPMIDPKFTGTKAANYWTGDAAIINGQPSSVFVYDVNFGTGETSMRGVRTYTDLVRCVRGS